MKNFCLIVFILALGDVGICETSSKKKGTEHRFSEKEAISFLVAKEGDKSIVLIEYPKDKNAMQNETEIPKKGE